MKSRITSTGTLMAILLCIVCAGCANSAQSKPPQHELRILPHTLGDCSVNVIPSAVDDSGMIVGKARYIIADVAVLWKGKELDIISSLGPVNSAAEGMNTHGVVVGWFAKDFGGCQAYLAENGRARSLHDRMYRSTSANGINTDGVIAGTIERKNKSTDAAIWKANKWHILPSLGGGAGSAWDINDQGVVVGWSKGKDGGSYPVQWTEGQARRLELLPDGKFGEARAIANDGSITGHCESADGNVHAVLWTDGKVTDLTTLGGKRSYAQDIIDGRRVVGWTENASGEEVAFLWQNGTMHDLNKLTTTPDGVTLRRAFGISSNGTIAGTCTQSSSDRAFLLSTKKRNHS